MAPPKNAVGPFGQGWTQPASISPRSVPSRLCQPQIWSERNPNTQYGYVYAVECCGAVKVGATIRAPEFKLMQLQIGSPHKLHMLGALSDRYDDESLVHRLLDPFWIRGEWFALVPECRALLDRLLSGERVASLLDEREVAA